MRRLISAYPGSAKQFLTLPLSLSKGRGEPMRIRAFDQYVESTVSQHQHTRTASIFAILFLASHDE